MKKLALTLCLLVATLAAQAQFEKDKWFINPAITGLNIGHSDYEGFRLGLEGEAGAFLANNVALLVNVGLGMNDAYDQYQLGVGGRYYFNKSGIYMGAGVKYNYLDFDNLPSVKDYALSAEVGYAFFLGRNVTLEPAAYYNISLKDGDYSKYGLKLGFGLYF